MKNTILTLTTLVSLCFSSFALCTEFMPKSFSAEFEQEYISTLKGKVKKGNGSLDYQYPGNIRFKTTLPSEILFISNGAKSWYYRAPFIEGEEGEVTETSTKDGSGIFTKFFDSLKNGLENNSLYSVAKKDKEIKINFLGDSSKDTGISEAILKFHQAQINFSNLQTIELVFPDKKRSTIKLKNIKINPSFDLKIFQFTAPPRTKKV